MDKDTHYRADFDTNFYITAIEGRWATWVALCRSITDHMDEPGNVKPQYLVELLSVDRFEIPNSPEEMYALIMEYVTFDWNLTPDISAPQVREQELPRLCAIQQISDNW